MDSQLNGKQHDGSSSGAHSASSIRQVGLVDGEPEGENVGDTVGMEVGNLEGD